jgi:diaminopimelate decarboxylase/aspartate kinase
MQATVNPVSEPELVLSELETAGAKISMDPAEASAVLVQGFIGSTPKGDVCLLGRGGSDTSGALFAALVGAKRYEIWTDVHGLFTSDPRFVEGTRLIKSTNYRTAQELATLGAKVLHERCLVPAAWGNIPVEVHNTADPDGPMTRIETSKGDDKTRLLGVTTRKGQTLLNIKTLDPLWGETDFLAKVFAPIGNLGVATDLVAVSQYTVSLVLDYIPGGIDGDAFSRLTTELKSLGTVTIKSGVAVVSVIGENLRQGLPELGKALDEMKQRDVYMMSQSSEDLSISFVVDEDAAAGMVQGLHNFLLCGPAETGQCLIDDEVFGQSWDELKTEFLKVESR